MNRDKRQRVELKRAGWLVLVVWESDILRKRTRESTLCEIEEFLNAK